MSEEIESLVAKFGEEHRRLISDAIEWLDSREVEWMKKGYYGPPLNRKEFIKDLISRVAK